MAWSDWFNKPSGGKIRRCLAEIEAAHGYDENGQKTGEIVMLPKNAELMRQYNKERGQGFRPLATLKQTDGVALVNDVLGMVAGLETKTCNQIHKMHKDLSRRTLITTQIKTTALSPSEPAAGKKGQTVNVKPEQTRDVDEQRLRNIVTDQFRQLLEQMGIHPGAPGPAPAVS